MNFIHFYECKLLQYSIIFSAPISEEPLNIQSRYEKSINQSAVKKSTMGMQKIIKYEIPNLRLLVRMRLIP